MGCYCTWNIKKDEQNAIGNTSKGQRGYGTRPLLPISGKTKTGNSTRFLENYDSPFLSE